jgi:hypothetical protein
MSIRPSESEKYDTLIDSLVWQASVNVGTDEAFQLGEEWAGYHGNPKAIRKWIEEHPSEMVEELNGTEKDLLKSCKAIILHVDSDGLLHAGYYDDLDEAQAVWTEIERDYEEEFEGQEDEIG